MATNRGILTVMQRLWPHADDETVFDVKSLTARPMGRSMALDHFRKMCGGCHLHRPRYPKLGEIGQRGGGCTDCHIIELEAPNPDLSQTAFHHPGLTTRIPSRNCVKCHNRSARIGLSYFGRFESEGYGTPFKNGAPGPRRLSGGRFYLELPADVHHEKGGMDCIDCHTEKGVMGNGTVYDHQEQQVDIDCRTCHESQQQTIDPDPDLTGRLVRANDRQPPSPLKTTFFSAQQSPLYHIRPDTGNRMILYRKRDGHPIPFNRLSTTGIHDAPYHRRLSCQACHTRWIPQCYGCHETRFDGAMQRDWLTGRSSPGRWTEGRGYLRFRKPTLGIRANGRIGPFAPGCQVFINVVDPQGKIRPEATSRHLVMAGFDPHTTAVEVPSCEDCHLDPKVMGLGQGTLTMTNTGLSVELVSSSTGDGIDFPLDAFVSTDGQPLQTASRVKSRPFNPEELKRIYRVGPCLSCHDRYLDPIYRSFDDALQRFKSGKTPCREMLK
jgi:hypothetical protein